MEDNALEMLAQMMEKQTLTVLNKMDRLEAKFDKLETKVDKLETKVDKLEVRVETLFEEVNSKISLVAEGLETHRQQNEREHTALRNLIEDKTDLLGLAIKTLSAETAHVRIAK